MTKSDQAPEPVTDEPWGPCECDEDVVGAHWKGCHLRSMDFTKADFVWAAEGGARAAIESYQFMLDEGFSPDEAKQSAVDEAQESAVCFAGIGSCYGGGCKHG